MSTTFWYLLMMPVLVVLSANATLSDAETTSVSTLISVDNVENSSTNGPDNGYLQNENDTEGHLVGILQSFLQNYEQTSSLQLDAYARGRKGGFPSVNIIKPRVNVMTDTASVMKVNLSLGLFFYVFLILGLILDAVRVSKEARRRSAAMVRAKLRKNQPLTKSQTLAYKHRKSFISLFAKRSHESKVKKDLEVSTSPSSNRKSAASLQDPLPSIPETESNLEEVISAGKAAEKTAQHL
ncbi:uncharacterized protein [Osmerus mordax]|uniref:uncharacterized protein isoform X1 n=2 Tax=Osmerus mordax TaxID=8014 RepID=UPI00350EBF2A